MLRRNVMNDYPRFEDCRDRFPLAMAYVPWQERPVLYENLEEGFCNGTIFPELNKPFTGRRCVK